MARGIERAAIFRDDADRRSFLRRLERLVQQDALEIFAWALLPNHFHLLAKSTRVPLSIAMRSLLTGHAVWFNQRHGRVGHLFQNRFRSIICEEEPYFLELVRYIHLNPLRAAVVDSLDELNRYPFCGHSALIGSVTRRWQRTAPVLDWFDADQRSARAAYQRFVALGIDAGRRPDLMGGGLVRSAGGWAAVREIRKAREAFTSDERILGTPGFVRSLLRVQAEGGVKQRSITSLEELTKLVCRATGTDRHTLSNGGRRESVSRAREGVSFLWIDHFGESGHEVAAQLGIAPVSAYRCAARGRESRAFWVSLLQSNESNNVP